MCDDDPPLRVTVVVPSFEGPTYGRDSTYSPDALVTSIRLPASALEIIDRARDRLGHEMTRSLFIRQCAVRVAQAMLAHSHSGDTDV